MIPSLVLSFLLPLAGPEFALNDDAGAISTSEEQGSERDVVRVESDDTYDSFDDYDDADSLDDDDSLDDYDDADSLDDDDGLDDYYNDESDESDDYYNDERDESDGFDDYSNDESGERADQMNDPAQQGSRPSNGTLLTIGFKAGAAAGLGHLAISTGAAVLLLGGANVAGRIAQNDEYNNATKVFGGSNTFEFFVLLPFVTVSMFLVGPLGAAAMGAGVALLFMDAGPAAIVGGASAVGSAIGTVAGVAAVSAIAAAGVATIFAPIVGFFYILSPTDIGPFFLFVGAMASLLAALVVAPVGAVLGGSLGASLAGGWSAGSLAETE